MRLKHWPRLAVCGALLLGAGCTSLREIPRSQYAAQPERKNVRLETQEGLVYEFDYVQVGGDSLTGFRRRESEGPIEDYGQMSLPLDRIAKLSARGVNWYRTGLIGGGVIAAVVAAGLNSSNNNHPSSDNGGGGKAGGVP